MRESVARVRVQYDQNKDSAQGSFRPLDYTQFGSLAVRVN